MAPRRGVIAILFALLWSPAIAQVDLTERLDLNDFNATVGSGARAWGMGGAFVAVADDATAASWNPAGLGILQIPEITLVLVPIDDLSFDYQGDTARGIPGGIFATTVREFTGFASKSTGDYLDYASFAYPVIREKISFIPQISYQRAINRNFNIAQRIPAFVATSDDFNIEQNALIDQQIWSEGGFDVMSAALAVRFNEKLSLGISLNYWSVDLQRTEYSRTELTELVLGNLQRETRESTRQIDQNGDGLNANIGLMWRPIHRLSVGAVYKSGFNLDLDIRDVTVNTIDGLMGTPIDASGSATIEWPETYALGMSVKPIDQLLLSVDVTRSGWSDAVLRGTGVPGGQEPFPGGSTVKSQEDARQIRLGGEYSFSGEGFTVPLRLGLFEDRQILRDARNHTVDILGMTFGVGVTTRKWIFDLAVVRTESSEFRTPDGGSFFDVEPRGDGELETRGIKVYLSGIYRFAGKKKF